MLPISMPSSQPEPYLSSWPPPCLHSWPPRLPFLLKQPHTLKIKDTHLQKSKTKKAHGHFHESIEDAFSSWYLICGEALSLRQGCLSVMPLSLLHFLLSLREEGCEDLPRSLPSNQNFSSWRHWKATCRKFSVKKCWVSLM